MPGIFFFWCFWFEWSGDVLSLLMKEEKKRREKGEERGRKSEQKEGNGEGWVRRGNVRPAGMMGRGTPGFSGRGGPTRPSRER
jgi:hypothetical protein